MAILARCDFPHVLAEQRPDEESLPFEHFGLNF
jgi:hypothetical protein